MFDFRNNDDVEKFDILTKNCKLCVVDFYADWCGPCKKLGFELENKLHLHKNLVLNLANSDDLNDIEKLKSKIAIVKVNIDVLDDLANNYQVSSIPHVIFFKNGKLQSNVVRTCDKLLDYANGLF